MDFPKYLFGVYRYQKIGQETLVGAFPSREMANAFAELTELFVKDWVRVIVIQKPGTQRRPASPPP